MRLSDGGPGDWWYPACPLPAPRPQQHGNPAICAPSPREGQVWAQYRGWYLNRLYSQSCLEPLFTTNARSSSSVSDVFPVSFLSRDLICSSPFVTRWSQHFHTFLSDGGQELWGPEESYLIQLGRPTLTLTLGSYRVSAVGTSDGGLTSWWHRGNRRCRQPSVQSHNNLKIKPNLRTHTKYCSQPRTDRQLMGTSHFPTFGAAFLDMVLDLTCTQTHHLSFLFKRNNGLRCWSARILVLVCIII